MSLASQVPDVRTLAACLSEHSYIADDGLATSLFCAVRLPQPLLLEGEAGVGKTRAAHALADVLGSPLIRLQCFEGIGASEALYEWNYPKQLLAIRLAESTGERLSEGSLFDREFLIERPILRALEHPGPSPAVLLVDEVDRADEEFEAFLLEMLAESAVTVPELGTLKAAVPPVVILTSNRTRDLHDALKRRCLYHWIDFPDAHQVARIVHTRVPAAPVDFVEQIAHAVARMRSLDMQKPPGVAEAIDWVNAAMLLGITSLDQEGADSSLDSVLKYREDQQLVRALGPGWIAGD